MFSGIAAIGLLGFWVNAQHGIARWDLAGGIIAFPLALLGLMHAERLRGEAGRFGKDADADRRALVRALSLPVLAGLAGLPILLVVIAPVAFGLAILGAVAALTGFARRSRPAEEDPPAPW